MGGTTERLDEETLRCVRDQLGGHSWDDAQLAELISPTHGMISGLQALLDGLARLRAVDLGRLPPEEPLPPRQR